MSCDCGTLKPTSLLSPLAPQSVPAIMAADEIVAGWDAALGVSGGATVAQWNDLGSGGFNLTQAVAGERPTFNAAGGPNGNPSVLFDGVDDNLTNTVLDLPAPAATRVFFWSVLRQVTWTNGRSLFQSTEIFVFQDGLTPAVTQYNTASANNNAGLSLNSYGRLEAYFSDSVADYLKLKATTVTGSSAGSLAGAAGFAIPTFGAGGGHVEVCELWIFNVLPSPAQLAQLDIYAATRYGATVLT